MAVATAPRRRPTPAIPRPTWRRRLRGLTRVSLILVIGIPTAVAIAAAVGFWLLLYGNLPGTVPEPNAQVESRPSQVVDAQGNVMAEFREFDLTVDVAPEDVPDVVEEAVVAAEDRNFWEHDGVDIEGVARAAVANYEEGETVQGGSTITQQYIKAQFLSGERSIERKLTEAILATRLERELSKEEILFRYLDTTYFGGGAYGVGAAAESYFRKPVSQLTLSEAATLASVIPAPTAYEPRANPFVAEVRRQEVLRAMHEEGYLTDAELDDALGQTLWFASLGPPPSPTNTVYHPAPLSTPGPYPYYVDYIRQYMESRYGHERLFRGGLRIEAAIDPNLQALADEAVRQNLEGTEPPLEMSLVSIEPATGLVRALVGGRDWTQSQVNLATGGTLGMQAGSAFKVFTLAAALEQGYTPETVYPAPGTWQVPGCTTPGQCSVRNYSGGGYGSLSLTAATHASVNTVFAQLINDVGPQNVAALANRVGVSRIDPAGSYGISLTLGAYEVSPLDMASGYATFANHGVHAPATPVVRVWDVAGVLVEDNSAPHGEQVVNPAVADWVTQILRGVVTSGTGRRADIGRPVAGKTGTAQEYRAAWFAGYTPQLATAVWMGYSNEPAPLRNVGGFSRVTGGSIPARTWAAFMEPALAGAEVLDFAPPGALPTPNGDVPVRPGNPSTAIFLPTDCGGRDCAGDSQEELDPTLQPAPDDPGPTPDEEGAVEQSDAPIEPVAPPGDPP